MRLNAILKPRPPMSPRVAMTAVAAATSLCVVVAAGSGALALAAAPPAAKTTPAGASTPPAGRGRGGITFIADEAIEQRDGPTLFKGAVQIRLDRVTGDPTEDARLTGVTFLIDGEPAPAGFDPAALPSDQVERVEVVQGATSSGNATYLVNIIRGAGTKVPSVRARSRYSYRAHPDEHYRDADAVAYQSYCASGEPGPVGFCAGVLFGLSDKSGVCVPEGTDDNLLVERTLPVIAAGRPKAGESLRAFAAASLKTAWPCSG